MNRFALSILAALITVGCGALPQHAARPVVPGSLAAAAAADTGLRKQVRAGLSRFFEFADADHDGAVDTAEAASANASYADLDPNHDGRLTRAELFSDRTLQTVFVILHDEATRKVPELDADHSGQVSLDELKAHLDAEAYGYTLPIPDAVQTAFVKAAGPDRQLDQTELRAVFGVLFERGYGLAWH